LIIRAKRPMRRPPSRPPREDGSGPPGCQASDSCRADLGTPGLRLAVGAGWGGCVVAGVLSMAKTRSATTSITLGPWTWKRVCRACRRQVDQAASQLSVPGWTRATAGVCGVGLRTEPADESRTLAGWGAARRRSVDRAGQCAHRTAHHEAAHCRWLSAEREQHSCSCVGHPSCGAGVVGSLQQGGRRGMRAGVPTEGAAPPCGRQLP